MSKKKKEAYAAKQQAAAAARAPLTGLPAENAPMGKTEKKAATRKQSRGK